MAEVIQLRSAVAIRQRREIEARRREFERTEREMRALMQRNFELYQWLAEAGAAPSMGARHG